MSLKSTEALARDRTRPCSWRTSLEGTVFKRAETEMVGMYDLDFTGCLSCFVCKRVGLGDHRCYIRDSLFPVLDRMMIVDAIVFGAPVYFSDITAGLVARVEVLLVLYTTYSMEVPAFCPRPIPRGSSIL